MTRRPWLWLALLLFMQTAAAQMGLQVAGQPVAGLDQDTVPGVSYAPATAYAAALGAELEIGFAAVELRMAGRLLQLRLTGDPAAAGAADSAALDGREFPGHAAVHTTSGVLLPVKTVATAFGGYVTVLGAAGDVVDVRMPTASLSGLERSGSGAGERLSVSLSAPVPVSVYWNGPLNTLQLTFARTRPAQAGPVSGEGFVQAWLPAVDGDPELRIQLARGRTWQLSTLPAPTGNGWQLMLFFPETAGAEPATGLSQPSAATQRGGTILLDPGAETPLVDLALAAATLLRSDGFEVLLTRSSAAEPVGSLLPAAGSDLYLKLVSGNGNSVAFLFEASDEVQLQQAVRLTGGDQPAVERLRRELLLGRHGDLSEGRRLARALQEGLQLLQPAAGLPLAELTPAAGRGVRLELSADVLSDPGLPERLAEALRSALEER